MAKKYDFAGWATRNDLKCSDGRTIKRDAFKECDGQIVPLVWNHQHNDSDNVLGHALLENRSEGVYTYCSFNDTEKGQNAKLLVQHGDITGLSIYANKLKQSGGDVLHGVIREVSLVLAGANPGAYIDSIMVHGEGSEEDAVIYSGEELVLEHSDEKEEEKLVPKSEEKEEKETKEMADKTVQEVIDSMNDEQKKVLYALVGSALDDAHGESDEGDEEDMKHNVFDRDEEYDNNVLSHSEMTEILKDAKRIGSLKDSFLEHGIEQIDYIMPEYQNVNGNTPGFINTIPSGWIDVVNNGVHHTPFSKVKMVFADITMDTARAKGYVKGNKKTEEVFKLLKRTVDATTIYKLQKFDRDDLIDITDLDTVAWVKKEMRLKLDEERARAYMFGDGRTASDNDKIDESKIIPVIKDTEENLYAMKFNVVPEQGELLGHAIITTLVKAMDSYEGSGNVTLFLRSDLVSDIILMEDMNGHRLYKNLEDLANAMTVDKIVKVPASVIPDGFYGVALDLRDYNVGATKGGEVNLFDDFDIDYNKYSYLIETRCSGALTLPHSAIVLAENGGDTTKNIQIIES